MDKTLGIETVIHFYEIEGIVKTEEQQEEEILVIHKSSIEASEINLVKINLPFNQYI